MGVASGCGEQEAGVASGSGWNLWVWLVGVVVRRYIDFIILLIPTPLVSVLFYSSPTFCSFFKMFFVLVPVLFCNLCNIFFAQYKHTYGRLLASHPRQPYEGLHIIFYTRRSTHKRMPAMDISCMPSKGGV